jgi:UDP-glucose 4-epimerase
VQINLRKEASKAIVTGGAGFVGSHIVDELIGRGIETYVIDNLTTGSLDNLVEHAHNELLHIVIGNVSNINKLMGDLKDIDVVFHEAAIANIQTSIENPILVNNVNVNSTLKVLDYCIKHDIKRIVFASSAAVYGVLDNVYVSKDMNSACLEDMNCIPNTPYSAGKLACENYLKAYHSTYGLETIMLRYFNIFGPRQAYSQYAGVINNFINKLLNKDMPVIFGDGLQSRDFVYVTDIVQANLLAMEKKGVAGESFNIGAGRSVTIIELLNMLRQITHIEDIPHKYAPPRPGDPKFCLASGIQKAREKLGYVPQTTITEGLKLLVEYITKKHYSSPNHSSVTIPPSKLIKNKLL